MNSLAKLLPYLRPHMGFLGASLLLALPLAALRTSPVPMVNYLIDDLMINRNQARLLFYPVIFILIFLLNFVVRFLHYYLLRIVTAKVNRQIKQDLFKHLMGLSADYFSSRRVGALISRVGSDPQYIDSGIYSFNVLLREPLTFLFLFGYAYYLNWKLTLVTTFIFPFLVFVFHATGRNLKRYLSRLAEHNAHLYSTLQEGFAGFRVIQVFGLEKYVQKKFRSRLNEYTHVSLKSAVMEEVAHPLIELITAFAVAAVLYYGGALILNQQMSPGNLVSFFTAFAMMINPIRLLNDVNIKLNQAAAAADRINEILSWQSHLPLPKSPRQLDGFNDRVRFDSVSFSYPDEPGRQILNNISFDLPRGQTLAIVGESGVGKSSVVHLIPRLFDVVSGRITIDGVDVREIDPANLRQMIAVVSQDIFLFNDTIEENIRCGRLAARTQDVRRAAEHAHALAFIEQMPDGFRTMIGDRGQKLSGGEKQRLSIARAFLRDAPILILDEATSNLDGASEQIVQNALDELMSNKTCIIVAHRLSTIRKADRIIVLKNGAIAESGDHKALMELNGEYARFQAVHANS